MSKEEKIVGQCKSSVSKELDALERVDDYVDKDYDYCQRGDYSKDYKLIKQALQRLEAIDNANPSKAMDYMKSLFKCWEHLVKKDNLEIKEVELEKYIFKENYDAIKQALIKAQEQEKVLEIIKKKNVLINGLKHSMTLGLYNKCLDDDMILTQEEFELLKRYFK